MASGVDTNTGTRTHARTHAHAHAHTHTHTHTQTYRCASQSNFKKPGARGLLAACAWFKNYTLGYCKILIDTGAVYASQVEILVELCHSPSLPKHQCQCAK